MSKTFQGQPGWVKTKCCYRQRFTNIWIYKHLHWTWGDLLIYLNVLEMLRTNYNEKKRELKRRSATRRSGLYYCLDPLWINTTSTTRLGFDMNRSEKWYSFVLRFSIHTLPWLVTLADYFMNLPWKGGGDVSSIVCLGKTSWYTQLLFIGEYSRCCKRKTVCACVETLTERGKWKEGEKKNIPQVLMI